MRTTVLTSLALSITTTALAQEAPPPKLGRAGESCRISADCADAPCVEGVCDDRAKLHELPEEHKEISPVEHYRAFSVALTSGMDLLASVASGPVGFLTEPNTGPSAIVQLGASGRIVVKGVVIGLQLDVALGAVIVLVDQTAPSTEVFITPGVSVGYAIPISNRVALTPGVHANVQIATSSVDGISLQPVVQLTGEVALEYFVGRHGFIEAVVAAGDYQATNGSPQLLFGVGYRLGVVF